MTTNVMYKAKNSFQNLAKFKLKKKFTDGPNLYINKNLEDGCIASFFESN